MVTAYTTTKNVRNECKNCRELIQPLQESLQRLNLALKKLSIIPGLDISDERLEQMVSNSHASLANVHSLQYLICTLNRHAPQTNPKD